VLESQPPDYSGLQLTVSTNR